MLTSNIILKIVKMFMSTIVKSFKISVGEIYMVKIKKYDYFHLDYSNIG